MKYFLWKVCKTDYKTLWVIPNISGYHQFLGAQMKILYFFPIFMCICSEGEILHLVSGRPCIQYPATPTHTHATPQAGFLTLRSFCMESTWIWTHSLGPKTHNNQNLKNWRPGKDPRRSEPQKTQGGTRDHCVRGPTGTCPSRLWPWEGLLLAGLIQGFWLRPILKKALHEFTSAQNSLLYEQMGTLKLELAGWPRWLTQDHVVGQWQSSQWPDPGLPCQGKAFCVPHASPREGAQVGG